jgi:hypothetical protein
MGDPVYFQSKLWFHGLDSEGGFAIVVIEANKLPWQINSQVHKLVER